MTETEIKQRVRQFYDRVGWQTVNSEDGVLYQNARYEDLRPVSREYIHRCHLRVNRFLKPAGRYLLDAGSGPIQYAEYLTYSQSYQRRVCVDLSIVALQAARQRIGEHGLFVVADVANLPFQSGPFDSAVSLHTFHHLPLDEQFKAYQELYRVLSPGAAAVVVNGWTDSPLMRRLDWLMRVMERLRKINARLGVGWRGSATTHPIGRKQASQPASNQVDAQAQLEGASDPGGTHNLQPTGTFISKLDPAWLKRYLAPCMRYQLYPWRSVSVPFLRAVIHPYTGGRFWLRLLFFLEEHFPRFFAEKGQYPMVVVFK